MRLSIALLTLSAVTSGLAQQSQNPVIQVGSTPNDPNGIYRFIPNNLTNIANGTTITFRFTGAPGNHSVTQSSFTDPCDPLSGGFDSGWVFIPDSSVSPSPEWNLTITNATAPLWFFCKQLVPLTHCSAGMVGAINAPESGAKNFSAFQSNAESFTGPSGQGEGLLVGQGASASAGPGPAVSGVTFYTAALATSTSPSGNSPSGNSSSGNSSTTGSGGSGQNGALTVTTNLLVVTLGVLLGSSLCLV